MTVLSTIEYTGYGFSIRPAEGAKTEVRFEAFARGRVGV